MSKQIPIAVQHILVDVCETKETFKRTRNPDGPDPIVGKSYRVVIPLIHYKLDPRDTRYQKSVQDIHTKMEKFS